MLKLASGFALLHQMREQGIEAWRADAHGRVIGRVWGEETDKGGWWNMSLIEHECDGNES
jgi:hypothetical protein